jgi:hypothetical protein
MRRIPTQYDGHAIRRIVWSGPYAETGEGRTIRGAVGVTYHGKYRFAEFSLRQEQGPDGRVASSSESSKWSDRFYTHKEHAIYAARESIARTLRAERQVEIPDMAEGEMSPALKYGANTKASCEVHMPRRSR